MNIERNYLFPSILNTINRKEEDDFVELIGFQDLPEELCVKIFSFLTPKEAIKNILINRKWKRLLEDKQLWPRYSALSLKEFVKKVKFSSNP